MAISATNISPQTPSSPRHSRVSTMSITLSTSAQQKLNLLLQQEAEFDSNSAANQTSIFSEEDSPKYPTSAHIPPALALSVDPPAYDEFTTINMPTTYTSPKITPDSHYDTLPTDIDAPWPITKKLYFMGFIFWPLWFIGMGFSIFGKSPSTRKWGRHCACNSVVVLIVFAYLVTAYIRTNGRWT
ncbi:16696_t:CDS:1 [Dentiscutata erythropus]|uniref:16696_t:CDS:1 n=1 Tax=Dentiscutata erythropus TaxID=1348616 RepID=A0A9N9JQ05_9GLOM|nr:16696_t:CDS:1 [Dentiscutata erythropus]